MASLISPTVARKRAALTLKSSKFAWPPSPFMCNLAAAVISAKAFLTACGSRLALMAVRRLICESRTATLSTCRMSRSASSFNWYLLTPTITSSPRSIRACLRAADSSMRNFGRPSSMALAMPPFSSISSIKVQALSANCWVNDSIM